MTARSVALTWTDPALISDITARVGAKPLADALGYLTTFGLGQGLALVDIRITPEPELAALYWKDADAKARSSGGFLMVGIWRADEGRFFFHT